MVFGGITDDVCKVTVKGEVRYYKRIHVLEFDAGKTMAISFKPEPVFFVYICRLQIGLSRKVRLAACKNRYPDSN